MIRVNTGLISAAKAPFGGIKEGSVGRAGSKYILCILWRQSYVGDQSFVLIWFYSLFLPTVPLQTLSIGSSYLYESSPRCAECPLLSHTPLFLRKFFSSEFSSFSYDPFTSPMTSFESRIDHRMRLAGFSFPAANSRCQKNEGKCTAIDPRSLLILPFGKENIIALYDLI